MFDLLANVMSAPLLVPMDINIDPNTNGLPGINPRHTIVGAVMTIGLILSVLALIVSAIVWGFGANSSPRLAREDRCPRLLRRCGDLRRERHPHQLAPEILSRDLIDPARNYWPDKQKSPGRWPRDSDQIL